MALAVGWLVGCSGGLSTYDESVAVSESSLADNDGTSSQLFAVDSHPYGSSLDEWAFDWMRWEYSVPAATNPQIVAGVDYAQNQQGPVFFVPLGPNHNDAFTVPRHKALAVMLSQINTDYPCPDPTFQPAPGQSLFDFLSTGLTEINDSITVMQVTLDGQPIVDPFAYRFTASSLISFVGDPSLAASFDPCVTGTPQPAVVDDFFLLFKPLPGGQHVLKTHIENSFGHVFDRTRTITVE
jgi:hypothetical protein